MRPRGGGHACQRDELLGLTYNHVGDLRCVKEIWVAWGAGAVLVGGFGDIKGVWTVVGFEAAV
jgi:hypothetical protein